VRFCKKIVAEKLTDKHVVRVVRKTALATGLRGDFLKEREGRNSGTFAARRTRHGGRGR
jgi:hypothetical protein